MTTFTEIVVAQIEQAGDHASNVAMLTTSVMGDAIIDILAEGGNEAAIQAAALGKCIKKLREKYQLQPQQPLGPRIRDVAEFSGT